MITVVLIEPKIPQNTGTIARLCAATNSTLLLVGELGFSLDDKYLKRAGLDYWDQVSWSHEPDLDAYTHQLARMDPPPYLLSSKVPKPYTSVTYSPNQTLVFGSETTGLSASIKSQFHHQCITIPMANPAIRSLNLANSVSIIVYETLRQTQVSSIGNNHR